MVHRARRLSCGRLACLAAPTTSTRATGPVRPSVAMRASAIAKTRALGADDAHKIQARTNRVLAPGAGWGAASQSGPIPSPVAVASSGRQSGN